MTINLLDTLSYALGDGFAGLAAAAEIVPRHSDHHAAGAVVPVLLGGLLRLDNTPGGPASLRSLLDRADAETTVAEAAAQADGDPQPLIVAGRVLLETLFGDRLGDVAEAIAPRLALDAVSAARVLALAAPLVLGKLGRLVDERRLDANGLSRLLHEQASLLAATLPAGLPAAIGLHEPTPDAGTVASDAGERLCPPGSPPAQPAAARQWLPWLIAATALLLALTQLRQCASDTAPPGGVPPAPPGDKVSTTAARPGPVLLYFDAASIAAPDDSEVQLRDIIGYAGTHDDAHVRITGYLAPTGDRAASEALARDRAHSVKAVLVLAGIQAERIDLAKPLAAGDGASVRERHRVEVSLP